MKLSLSSRTHDFRSSSNNQQLRFGTLQIHSQSWCDYQYNGTRYGSIPYGFKPDLLCAGYVISGEGSCTGDSGGPLVTFVDDPNDPFYVQVAVVVGGRGSGCNGGGSPGIYTRLDDPKVLDWIKQHIGGPITRLQHGMVHSWLACTLSNALDGINNFSKEALCQFHECLFQSHGPPLPCKSSAIEVLRGWIRLHFSFERYALENCLDSLHYCTVGGYCTSKTCPGEKRNCKDLHSFELMNICMQL